MPKNSDIKKFILKLPHGENIFHVCERSMFRVAFIEMARFVHLYL